jgi:predicted regulator of Ras-like GTPase activity (Roadblock/LC7/MglB family)
MDAAQALEGLTEISSQIEAACLFDSGGAEIATTLRDDAAARRFVEAARALLTEAQSMPRDADAGPLAQLEAATLDGSVFVVLDGDRAVAAATKPEPTVGLVFYDLKSCLRALAAEGSGDGRPRPKARKREAKKEYEGQT